MFCVQTQNLYSYCRELYIRIMLSLLYILYISGLYLTYIPIFLHEYFIHLLYYFLNLKLITEPLNFTALLTKSTKHLAIYANLAILFIP